MKNLFRISGVILLILSIFLIHSCKKKEEVPVITTTAVSNITATTATSGGNITSEGSSTVISRGVCWSTGTTPTIADSKTADGAGAGSFSSNLTVLNGATNYYVRAYASNSVGTGYGMAMSFTTLGKSPSPTVALATNINATGARLNGTVNANYLSTVVTFEYGTTTSYGSTATPSQSPVNGNVTTNVSSDITGLAAATIYHFRVKSVNSLGITYSNDLTFTTLGQAPDATTQAATNTVGTSTILNGSINAHYLSTVVTFEYGTTTSYGSTITSSQSPVTGNSTTSVNANLSGLTPNTTYHFRVKTVNVLGTNYGNDLTFTTLGQAPVATTQAASNITTLSTTLNGIVNANYLSTTITFEYGTTVSYVNSVTAIQSPVTGNSTASVGAAVLGLSPYTIYHYRIKAVNVLGTTYGSDMTFTTLGQPPTTTTLAATNILAFSSTLNGTVNPNFFASTVTFEYGTTTSYGITATATQSPVTGNTNANVRVDIASLTGGTTYHFRIVATNSLGTTSSNDMIFKTLGQTPSVITQAATNITSVSTSLNGTVNANYLGSSVTFEYGTTTSYGIAVTANQSPVSGNANTNVNADIVGLTGSTLYHFRIVATNLLGTTYGNDLLFTTLLMDFDGNIYNIVTIGTQVWMAENLKTTKYNDGTAIPNIIENATWAALITGAYTDLNNSPSNSITYGRLYNWYAVDNNAATKVASNGGKNVCPTSWHVSTDAEWTALTTYLGGESVASGKLKEVGTIHWQSPNTEATNETGFKALPGGNRNYLGTYYGNYGIWWSSTEYSTTDAWYRHMLPNSNSVYRNSVYKQFGYSIRCLKD